MATLDTLERRLDDVVDRLERSYEDLVVDIAREIAERLVPGTPVDTGFARGNWRPSLNAPAEDPITFLDITGQATVEKIVNVARRWKLGDTLFIVSRIDYISALNAGSSPQAEPGFIERAVEEGTAAALQSRSAGIL